MSNLDIAVSSFWQLARHWRTGQKAKLELSCEDGSLHLQLSAMLGHPDQASFPDPPFPPPPSSCKRKSPSQQRRKQRRQEEGLCRAATAASDTEEGASKKSHEEETETMSLPKDNFEIPATDHSNKPADKPAETCESLKCNQCSHEANCKVSLRKHTMREHKKPVIDERFKCDVCRENQESKNDLKIHMISEHDHPGEIFTCELCDFMTSRKTGLTMHSSKKHKDIEQLDGISSDTEDTYAESYWERDYLGTVYQNYLDAIQNIKNSKLSIEEQHNEIEIAKDTRMNDLLDNGYTKRDLERIRMPPWTYS